MNTRGSAYDAEQPTRRTVGQASAAATGSVLYVGLDGTLIATDLLHESVLLLVRAAPLSLLKLPQWGLRGKAAMKREIAQRVRLNVATLPYREEVLQLVRAARAAGRRTVLATASDLAFAEQVAAHLGLFDQVIASDGETNRSGGRKLEAIQRDAQGQPFVYAGDAPVDFAIWRAAEAAIVVSPSPALAQRVAGMTRVDGDVRTVSPSLRRHLYGMRLHQWLKNLLIFVPLLPVLHATGVSVMIDAVLAFVAFGLMASGVYIVNDLLDLESDRKHHRKRSRPFASGEISIARGVVMAGGLFGSSILLTLLLLPIAFFGVLAAYFVLTTAYSVDLKRRPIVDVFALAGLYTVRIVAGAAATRLPLSFWMLLFSLFIFLSLALAKRHAELTGPGVEAGKRLSGRGYLSTDLPFVLASGISAGQMSILVLSLYLYDNENLQRHNHPEYLWALIPLLLFWVSRVWFKASRHELHDDPVVFAARDPVSRVVGVCAVLVFWLSS